MKKAIVLFLVLAIVIIVMWKCGGLSDCDLLKESEYYVATADFFYSNDKGHSYGNGTKEYQVGETVYMKIKAKVTTNKKTPETIKIKLTIPSVKALDAKYYDGQPITPVYDAVQNITTYEFTITASQNAQEWEFVFQFVPNEEAEVLMTLVFDDHLDSAYDKQNTIKFVLPDENTEANEVE